MTLVRTAVNEESVGVDRGPMHLRWDLGVGQLRALLNEWGLCGSDR